jgi:hypothetical protein
VAEPPVTLQAVHDDGPGNLMPTRVVIHATCPDLGYPEASAAGQAASTAHYFDTAEARGSAHYVVDVAGEQHCVPDAHIAWHAPPNQHSIGIEVCGEATYTREQWLSPAVWPAVVRAAGRTAELCARFAIPAVRIGVPELHEGGHGICGHVDVSETWHQSTHTDPGPGFPWPEFMAAVTGSPTSSPAAAAAPSEEDPVSDVSITVRPDGTFRRLITAAEAGPQSAALRACWVKFGMAYGPDGGTADFRVCQLDEHGVVLPNGEVNIPGSPRNLIHGVVVLDGCVAVTVEGRCDPTAEVNASVIALSR